MKVRNTHIGAVNGIRPGKIGEASAEEVRRWPWALVPVEPIPAPTESAPETPAPKRGPGRPPKVIPQEA